MDTLKRAVATLLLALAVYFLVVGGGIATFGDPRSTNASLGTSLFSYCVIVMAGALPSIWAAGANGRQRLKAFGAGALGGVAVHFAAGLVLSIPALWSLRMTVSPIITVAAVVIAYRLSRTTLRRMPVVLHE